MGKEPVVEECLGEWLHKLFLQHSLQIDYIPRTSWHTLAAWWFSATRWRLWNTIQQIGCQCWMHGTNYHGMYEQQLANSNRDTVGNNKEDRFSVWQNVWKVSYFYIVNAVHSDLKPQTVMVLVDDVIWVVSSHSGENWKLLTSLRSTVYRNIYHLNKCHVNYILHSSKRDRDGPGHRNITWRGFGMGRRRMSSYSWYFQRQRSQWGLHLTLWPFKKWRASASLSSVDVWHQ